METTWSFRSAKLHLKSTWKQRTFFEKQNDVEINTCKQLGVFDQQKYIEKVLGNDVENRRNLVFNVFSTNDSEGCVVIRH